MTDLVDTLTALSTRERRLVGLLLAIVLPLAVVFLVIVPLVERRSAGAQTLGEAEDLLEWVQSNARLYAAVSEPGAEAPTGVPGLAGLEQSLVATGLRDQLAALTNRGGGAVELSFDAIAFDRLMIWLTELPQDTGYQAGEVTVEATETPGTVSARLVLEPWQ